MQVARYRDVKVSNYAKIQTNKAWKLSLAIQKGVMKLEFFRYLDSLSVSQSIKFCPVSLNNTGSNVTDGCHGLFTQRALRELAMTPSVTHIRKHAFLVSVAHYPGHRGFLSSFSSNRIEPSCRAARQEKRGFLSPRCDLRRNAERKPLRERGTSTLN